MGADPVNGAHARHYINAAGRQHGAIVRLQEERAELQRRIAELEAEVEDLREGASG